MENKSDTVMPTGINRLNAAIKSQQDLGKAEFNLSFSDAKSLVAEIQQELDCAKGMGPFLDMDGNIVPLTTKVMYNDEGEELKVTAIKIYTDSRLYPPLWAVNYFDNGNIKESFGRDLHLYRHRSDSWEKLEEDVQKVNETDNICSYYDKAGKSCGGCPAADIPDLCSAVVLRDILHRAKTLAGRADTI
mgnify:FL=1